MLLGAAVPLRSQKPAAAMTVRLDQEIGRISPLIYGQFIEHIGRVVYEGIWVGPDSKIPNRNGYRLDTLRALQRVHPSVFRWPGGCFADTYHWTDGVGPSGLRLKRRNHWWLRDEPNSFGTDEFMEWCGMLKSLPYLSVNVGSGSVQEALDWLEYCNSSAETGFGEKRLRNGHAQPYGVRWWGIGNENWGCGGLFSPTEYAQLFRQYGVYFKRMGMSEGLQLVGVGHIAEDWNRKFLAALGRGLPYLDHLSIHHYFRHGPSTNFSDDQYTDLMLDLGQFENRITDAIGALEQVEPAPAAVRLFGKLQPARLGLVIDEWGVWYSDATFEDGFSQKGVLRDALFAAGSLNLFHNYAHRISMTNIAQVINCLQSLIDTDGAGMILTPTFHVYEMYQPHYDATAVRVELESSPLIGRGGRSRPAISASASKKGEWMTVTIVNQISKEAVDIEVGIQGGRPLEVSATSLTGPETQSVNTRDQPDLVSPKPWKVEIVNGAVRAHLPGHSIQAIRVKVA